MHKYKLIKEYPNREIGDIAVFLPEENDCNFLWEKNKGIISQDFQPDVTPKWFEPVFEIEDIVVHKNKTYKFIKDWGKGYCQLWDDEDSTYLINTLRFATHEEIIKYYEDLGWVKGAKVKCADGIKTLCSEDTVYIGQYHRVIVNTTEYKQYNLKDCQLIEKVNYPKFWEELSINRFKGYCIDFAVNRMDNKDVFATEEQAQSSLAFAQLTQLHKAIIDIYNKENNYDWKPNWNNQFGENWTICRFCNKLSVFVKDSFFYFISFPTKELAEFSLKYHEDLWKQYYELD